MDVLIFVVYFDSASISHGTCLGNQNEVFQINDLDHIRLVHFGFHDHVWYIFKDKFLCYSYIFNVTFHFTISLCMKHEA